jgi:hypothetical protein
MGAITKAVGVGLIVIFVAFAFPTFIASSDNANLSSSLTLEGEGDSQSIGDALRVTADNKTNDQVTLAVSTLQDGANTTSVVLNESETKSVTLEGEEIGITVFDIGAGNTGTVSLEVTYPKQLEWDKSARGISDSLPLVLAMLAVIMVGGLVGARIKS